MVAVAATVQDLRRRRYRQDHHRPPCLEVTRLAGELAGVQGDGEEFYDRDGEQILLPQRRKQRPKPEFLEWHGDEVFRAS